MKKKYATFTNLAAALMLLPLTGISQNLVPDDNVPGVMIAQGFDIKLGIDGLNYPSNITIGNGTIWVTEAGFPGVPPTVKKVTLNGAMPGKATIILTPAMLPLGMLLPPFTDITFKDGLIWISHRQVGANKWPLGAVSHFDPANPAATFKTVIKNLPSAGDHSNNTIEFAPNGRGYISLGSATNSGVVGSDNVFKWVEDAPGFRDMAPVDITFAPNGFTALVPTPLDPDKNAVTAAYSAFDSGKKTSEYVVAAATPKNPQDGVIAGVGSVYSFDPSAADVEGSLKLECWGLRNAFGLAFDASDASRLFISNNGADIRGQAGNPNDPLNPATYVVQGNRPISNDYDEMFEITIGGSVEFFGWPDYFHDSKTNKPLSVTDARFCEAPLAIVCAQPLFAESFAKTLVVKDAFAPVGQFVSVTGFAPSTSTKFGYKNNLFVTESGAFVPQTGAFKFTGYKVSRFDHITGQKSDFVVNSGSTPEELFVPEKMNKPVSTIFMGDTLLIVDLGVLEPGLNIFGSATGKVWMVSNSSSVGVSELSAENKNQLSQLMPNPANTEATINLSLDSPSEVSLTLLDEYGRIVKNLYNGKLGVGTFTHNIPTNGLSSGIYMVRSITEKGSSMRKLVVVH